VRIASALLDQVVAHALSDPANEVCGVIAVAEGVTAAGAANGRGHAQALRVHRAVNIHASPLKFEIDPKELLTLVQTCERDGMELGAIYHSHVRSAPYPSQTDINFAANWPGVEWLIVGLAGGEEPQARSYLIDGGRVSEVPVEIVRHEAGVAREGAAREETSAREEIAS
jgi:proteasome lid subunit RPN8/RPN11